MNRKALLTLTILCALLLPGHDSAPVHAQEPEVHYVTPTGGGGCTSWDDACFLQVALANPVDGDEIWLAEGTYVPTVMLPDQQEFSFTLYPGVKWFGGFPAGGGTWEERNWEAYPTILSGNIGDPDLNSDNLYHVVRSTGVDANAVLDGLTITGGYADGTNPHERGGGLLNINSSPTLANCRFVANHAAYAGGGMYNDHSSPVLSHVTFSGNSAGSAGGGMYCGFGSSPSLADCTFEANTSSLGGGMQIEGGSAPTLINVVFSGNSSSTNGGGLTSNNSSPTLAGVTFTANYAGSGGGGGIFGWGSGNLDLTDVTFSGNYAHSNGSGGALDLSVDSFSLVDVTLNGNFTNGSGRGGAMVMFGGTGTMTRVSFLGNYTGPGSGGGAVWLDSGTLTATDCRFEGNSSDAGGALYNDATTVYLYDSSLVGNSASADGGAIWNDNSGIIQLQGCTLAGNEAVNGNGGGAYNTGELTLVNSTVSGNIARGDGGGILTRQSGGPAAVTRLHNVTVTSNIADAGAIGSGDGGGLYYDGSAPRASSSIIAGNLDNTSSGSQAPDCAVVGSPVGWSAAYSLLGDNRGCEAYFLDGVDGNIVGGAPPNAIDPLLGQLGDNGGPAWTHALQAESRARDAGDPLGCTDHNGDPISADQRGMERPREGDDVEGGICDIGAFEAGPRNDAWQRAEELDLSGGSGTRYEYVDQLGQSRWYKFQVAPGSRITAEMVPPNANLDIALFGDIEAAYEELQAPTGETDLVQLNAQFASDAFSPFAYSPFAYSPFAYSPFAYSPFAYSPFAYSPFAYSPFAYSPFAYSPFAYSPFAYSPFAYSPFAYSPFAYSPFAYSPSDYSHDPEYTSAQVQTLMAISAFDGLASELIEVNTWDNHGWLYLRVSGRNGAFSVSSSFDLQVTQDVGVCEGVTANQEGDRIPAESNGYETMFLTDWTRFGLDPTDPDLIALQGELNNFVADHGGVVVDVGQGEESYIDNLNAQADLNPQCPCAKNLVAAAIKDVVNAYRAGNPLKYVVLVGNDDVIPFFRYPDRAEIGSEKDYQPPVRERTSSYASLTLGYVLSQDAYGSNFDLALNNATLPIPDLAVGRLVEAPADIMNILDAYTLAGGTLAPASALVTGYDFLEDAANEIAAELEAGLGPDGDVDTLITPDEISPQDRDGTPPLGVPWDAQMLRDLLLGTRHDLVFLAGHFTAQGTLAADYETHLFASELLDPGVDLENALVYSAGCHSGYNVVNEHGVPYVTVEPDWAQAFAQAGATYIGGTGYQYGDTDFLEYSERLYLDFTRELRCGAEARSVGQALVEAKQAYLAGTAQMRGIHEKALLEATLFGLPMFEVDGLSAAGCPADPASEVTEIHPYVSNPGAFLGLQYADLTVTSDLTLHTAPLRDVTDPDVYMDASYFSGTSGVVTNPAEPVLPLEQRNVHVPGYVLRGAGFRGGRFADLPSYIPLTGAATTETRAAHTPFQSDVLYPLQPWSVNYFDLLTDPLGGVTWLNVTPAQFVSDADGDIWTGTWRRFDDMEFRLYYSNHKAVLDEGAVPSLAAPPAILQVLATSGPDEVQFQVMVAGDLAAGIQEVWVTYTGVPCDGGACWQSRDLTQNADDSTLWEGTLSLNGAPSGDIRYVVHAVNGVGLVSLVTNQGAYFQIDVDPADPAEPPAGSEPASQPEGTTVELVSAPSSGAYSTEVGFSAVLRTLGGVPLEGQRLTFSLGAQQRSALTDVDGVAEVRFPLHGAPGEYAVSATFAGGADYARSCTPDPLTFTILKQGTQLSVSLSPSSGGSGVHVAAELTDAAGVRLPDKTVLFLVDDGTHDPYAVSSTTDLLGQTQPGVVFTPEDGCQVTAYFGDLVTLPDQTQVDLTQANYGPAVVMIHFSTVPEVPEITVDAGLLQAGMTAIVGATFEAVNAGETHTASWDWGDGSWDNCGQGGTENCSLEPLSSPWYGVTGSHTYEQAGVYTVRLRVVDDTGVLYTSQYQYIVVYDWTDGFVTGGGWIWSEPGWCRLDDLCAEAEDKANFGFVSRYKKGANQPTGNTEFEFEAGGLSFHSDSYDWLVVNQTGTNAQFKGAGSINNGLAPNGEPYKFMLWAGDDDPDTFRIKIWWDEDGSEIAVYDNGFEQVIGEGSIVIHQKD